MRVRILEPDQFIHLLNNKTIPVRIDITDHGLPDQYPAFRWHVRALHRNPWLRRRFGHFALVEPSAQEIFDINFGVSLEGDITNSINSWIPQEPTPVKPVDQGQNYPEGPLPENIQDSLLCESFMTAYELSFDHWLEVVKVVAEGEDVVEGVKNAALYSYAEILSSPDEYNLMEVRSIGQAIRWYTGLPPQELPHPDQWLASTVKGRAAIAMTMVAKLPFELDSPDLIEQVQAWWEENKQDAAYQLQWPKHVRNKYSFLPQDAREG